MMRRWLLTLAAMLLATPTLADTHYVSKTGSNAYLHE